MRKLLFMTTASKTTWMSLILALSFLTSCVTTNSAGVVEEAPDTTMARARNIRLLQIKDPTPKCDKLGSFTIAQKNRNLTNPQVQAARAFGDPNYVKHTGVSGAGADKGDTYDVYSCPTKKQ